LLRRHNAVGTEFAHQIINTATTQMKYVAISTKKQSEAAKYPDLNKIGVFSQMDDGTPISTGFRYLGCHDPSVYYWDGEI
jgi:uncharacterized cupin superfamily protein